MNLKRPRRTVQLRNAQRVISRATVSPFRAYDSERAFRLEPQQLFSVFPERGRVHHVGPLHRALATFVDAATGIWPKKSFMRRRQ
jgi:hypothetical protein